MYADIREGTFVDRRVGPKAMDFGVGAATVIVAASDSVNKDKADYVCDGTNDEVEINNAINSLPSGGGKVLLLEGTYYLSNPISITLSNVSLEGMGKSTVLYLTDNSNCNVIHVGDGSSSYSDISISKLHIDANKANQSQGYGIYFEGSSSAYLHRMYVSNCFINNAHDAGAGFYYCYDSSISSCTIRNCGVGIDQEGDSTDVTHDNLRIVNNFIYSCDGAGISLYYGNNAVVSSNFIQSCFPGITSRGYNQCITGNTILQTDMGIEIVSGERNVITGNTIYCPNDRGISVRGGKLNTVCSNIIYSESITYEIELYDETECVVVGNSICQAPRASPTGTGICERGSCDNNVISCNRLSGDLSSYLSVVGTNTLLIGNLCQS